jgi:3-(3-hydroxy-phenyl)propionate hydroxylase
MPVSFRNGRHELPRYPFSVPPELSGGTPAPYPVVIVGAGLTGLTAACALAQWGVRTVVLDDDDTVGVRGLSSRGVCYARKSLEIFERLGVYRRLLGKGVRWNIGRTFVGDEQIHEFDLAAESNGSPQPAFINLQQFYVEAFLVERALELGVDLRWNSQVISCAAETDGAGLAISSPAGAYDLRADWAIDCTGARAALAGSLGFRRAGSNTDDRWCIADVILDEKLPVERHTWVSARFNDGRAVWRHALADDVWRMDYQLDPGSDAARPDERDIRERLRRQFGREVPCRIVWTGTWTYRNECLERFRHGRVLFAGDAAHTMSPFGGRGGNSGIQDADNLAWKLAWVIAGKADDSLLDTYDDERRAAAIENIRAAERTGRFLRPRSPREGVYRDATLTLARRHHFARSLVNTGRMSIPNHYPESRLTVGRDGGRSVPNLPLSLPDGRASDLAGLMRWAGGDLVVLAPVETAALRTLEGRYPVRIVAASCAGVDAGDLLLLRPDLYCAGTFRHGDVAALQHALRTFTCTTTGTKHS